MWKDKACTHQTLLQQERVCLTTYREVYKTHIMAYWELWSLYEPEKLLERLRKTMLQKKWFLSRVGTGLLNAQWLNQVSLA